jgi:hypothetical protein
VLPRALAVLAAVILPLAVAIGPTIGLEFAQPLVPVVVTVVLALAVLGFHRHKLSNVVIGAALAGLSAQQAHGVLMLLDVTSPSPSTPIHDLREGPLPESASGIIRVQGFLRDEWLLDEYRTEEGARPDQNETPYALLVPFLGTKEAVVPAGRIVIVRVPGEHDRSTSPQTLQGQTGPVPQELLVSLVNAATPEALAKVEGVMLDTMVVPTRNQALTRLALSGGSSVLALILLISATRGRKDDEGPEDPSKDDKSKEDTAKNTAKKSEKKSEKESEKKVEDDA